MTTKPDYTDKAKAKINNLCWALDLTKCFRKQYQMSFIEFIINALMNSQNSRILFFFLIKIAQKNNIYIGVLSND